MLLVAGSKQVRFASDDKRSSDSNGGLWSDLDVSFSENCSINDDDEEVVFLREADATSGEEVGGEQQDTNADSEQSNRGSLSVTRSASLGSGKLIVVASSSHDEAENPNEGEEPIVVVAASATGGKRSVHKRVKRTIDSLHGDDRGSKAASTLTLTTYAMARLRQWTLTNEGQYRKDIAELGGIEAMSATMIATLKRYVKQTSKTSTRRSSMSKKTETTPIKEDEEELDEQTVLRMQQLGVAALANLAREEGLQGQIVQSSSRGFFRAIFSALKVFRKDANLQEKGLDAIGTLARNADNRKMLMEEYHSIQIILSAMKRLPDDVHVHRRACIALYRLLSPLASDGDVDDDGNVEEAEAKGKKEETESGDDLGAIIDAILTSMRHFREDVKIQQLSCGVLKALSRKEGMAETGHTNNQSRIISGGGLSTVLEAMAGHLDDSGVQEEACRLFGHLSMCHSERKFSIARSGALEQILKAMQNHPQNAKVQVAGCWALINLTSKLEMARRVASSDGAMSTVKHAKTFCPKNAAKILTRLRMARYAPIAFFS